MTAPTILQRVLAASAARGCYRCGGEVPMGSSTWRVCPQEGHAMYFCSARCVIAYNHPEWSR